MNQCFDAMFEIARQLVELEAAERQHKELRQWKEGKQASDALREDFIALREKFVRDMLRTPEYHATAVQETEAHIQGLRNVADPSWNPVFDYLEKHLLPDLRKEARRKPRSKKTEEVLALAAVAIALAAYFGTAVIYRTDVSAPMETRLGIEQRAASLSKVIQYDDWMGARVRRGGWLKGILLWPIKPTDEEITAGGEFAGLGLEAAAFVGEQHGCTVPVSGNDDLLSDEQLAFLEKLADKVEAADTKWLDPPLMTLVEAARTVGGC